MLSACLGISLLVAHGQVAAQPPARVFRVGLLSAAVRTADGLPPRPLREGLRELGYVEGRNLTYEARFADGQVERLPAFAAELVRLKVDVLVVQGSTAAIAAKQATSTIPIIMGLASGDAVATGLISSLARPGGNLTGMTDEISQLSAKRVELLKEALPRATSLGVLWNANDEGMTLRYRGIEQAAQSLRLDVQALPVRDADEFANAFAAITRRRPDAMIIVADVLTNMHRKRVVDFVSAQGIPTMYEFAALVRDGGLMSYGPSPEDSYRRAAVYVDRIFKGARVADLPAEQPRRYYLTVNARTAAGLGLTVPPSVLLRADEVIQ